MPLKVVIKYRNRGRKKTLKQVFLISHVGTIEFTGDFDYEYEVGSAEFTREPLSNRAEFAKLFLEGGATALFAEPFAKDAFCKAIYKQGMEAFLDGDEISEREELEILANTLSWALKEKKYDHEDTTLCKRIYQLMGPDGFAEIKSDVDRDMQLSSNIENQSRIDQTLRINLHGETIDIADWTVIASKECNNPLTFEWDFDFDLDGDFSDEMDDLCRCLGVHGPDSDFNKDVVDDPFEPMTDSKGDFLLIHTLTNDPVSTSIAKAIHRFGDTESAIATADASAEILWRQKNNEMYKITLAEIVSPDIEAELAIRRKQIPIFRVDMQLGKIQNDMLRPIWTWIYQHVNHGKDGWQWVRIDHENDDEIITDNEEVWQP
jgi:hypothetical protein